MTAKISADAGGTFGSLSVGATEAFRFGADTSGQLAGFRNILINGKLTINQRGVTIAAAVNGSYGPDRWKKVDASNMTQIVEAGNFHPSKTYTLSGTNVTTQQLTSPASGNWTLPNIPITATNVQLEEGSIATPFEQRPIGLELSLCQRYFFLDSTTRLGQASSATNAFITISLPTTMRTAPTFTAQAVGTISNSVTSALPVTGVAALTATSDGGRYQCTVASGLVAGDATFHFGHTVGYSAEL